MKNVKKENSNCLICQRIALIKKNKNPFFIAELKTGYLVLEDHQYFKGYVIFICKKHVSELHQLPFEFKKNFLLEMSLVAEVIYKIFKPAKLNYELLGNKYPYLHWHIIPRYKEDKLKDKPIWMVSEKIRKQILVKMKRI